MNAPVVYFTGGGLGVAGIDPFLTAVVTFDDHLIPLAAVTATVWIAEPLRHRAVLARPA